MTASTQLAATYLLPLKADRPQRELAGYLEGLAAIAEVIVIDGSDREVFEQHAAIFPATVRVVPVDPDLRTPMGKVGGVLTGLRRASHEAVVVADDDVRYARVELERLVSALEAADVAVPQNYFSPLPWHAVWDTGRTLLNRALLGHDYPGTLALRRSMLRRSGGYAGDVMFENLELLRTVRASGGAVRHLPGLYVRREPPTARHFRGQRVRQAYDSLAQPIRLALELAALPITVAAARRLGARALLGEAAAVVLVAELGRRRQGGRDVFPARTAVAAPAWVVERAVCSWLAIGARLRGGVPYGGGRLSQAAHPPRTLRARHGGGGDGGQGRLTGASRRAPARAARAGPALPSSPAPRQVAPRPAG